MQPPPYFTQATSSFAFLHLVTQSQHVLRLWEEDMAYSSGPTVWRMGQGLKRSHKKFYMVQNVLTALDLDRPFGATHMGQVRNKWQVFVTMGISLWDPKTAENF